MLTLICPITFQVSNLLAMLKQEGSFLPVKWALLSYIHSLKVVQIWKKSLVSFKKKSVYIEDCWLLFFWGKVRGVILETVVTIYVQVNPFTYTCKSHARIKTILERDHFTHGCPYHICVVWGCARQGWHQWVANRAIALGPSATGGPKSASSWRRHSLEADIGPLTSFYPGPLHV